MSNVKIIKGDLFSASEGSILVHACNTQGVWGSGIAAQFANEFPEAFRQYNKLCCKEGDNLLGTCFLIDTPNYSIGCLFTSSGYGSYVSKPDVILSNTRIAISDLIHQNWTGRPIHMCKINSGLFRVPWGLTQEVLEEFPEQEFTVYDF